MIHFGTTTKLMIALLYAIWKSLSGVIFCSILKVKKTIEILLISLPFIVMPFLTESFPYILDVDVYEFAFSLQC